MISLVGFSASAQQNADEAVNLQNLPAASGAGIVLVLMAALAWSVLTSKRLSGASLFHRLFIVVAIASGFFSAVSSAIGFSLITSQESVDFFRNSVLPPAFGVFVFFLAVAIWVGGAELVRHRDWFRNIGPGPLGDGLAFIERAFKLFVVIPVLALILFFVSTWTTVVGIGGADAVRHTYNVEIDRLQRECVGISSYRQKDFLFLEDLRLSINDVTRVAAGERQGGAQSGSPGEGAVTEYFLGIAEWFRGLEESVAIIIDANDAEIASPYETSTCSGVADSLSLLLSNNAFENHDRWARDFETAYNDFASTLNRWRHDQRIEELLEQQRRNFSRANPKPNQSRVTRAQAEAIDSYAEQVEDALASLIRRQRRDKPPIPIKSQAELSPSRGLDIFIDWVRPLPPVEENETKSRAQAVVDAEFVPALSTISPRDAVLKHANIFSDIWALAISWDYAAYLLMIAFLFFPSAERAAGHKN